MFHPESANRELLPVATSYHWIFNKTQRIMYIGRDLTMTSSLTPHSRQGLLGEGCSGQWKSWHSTCWRHGRDFLNSSWCYFGPELPFMFLIHYPSVWAQGSILMRSKHGGIAADGEGMNVLHLAMLQPLLGCTWAAFPRQGDGTEPPKQQCNGMPPDSQDVRSAPVTSRCKQHINTGAAEELAIKSSSFDYLIGKEVVYIPCWMCFMPLPHQAPTATCWCMVLLHRNFQEKRWTIMNCWWLKKTTWKFAFN